VSVPSSELGPPTLSSASEYIPPGTGGREHTGLRVKGWRGLNSDDWRKILALCLVYSVIINIKNRKEFQKRWKYIARKILATRIFHSVEKECRIFTCSKNVLPQQMYYKS
jgi:hypothetical protein